MKSAHKVSTHTSLSLMIMAIFLMTKMMPAQDHPDLPEGDQCIKCHMEQENMPEDFSDFDTHLQKNLSCAGCHGGDASKEDMDEAMNPKKGFIGVPAKKDIPRLCGKCHSNIDFMRSYQPRISTDQVDQYYTSIHGQKLKQGDKKVADCTSCHTGHSILSAKDARSSVYALNVPGTCKKCHSDAAYMKEYNIKTNQYEEYAKSIHGIALLQDLDTSVPACNDCHGNHGAIPPGVKSISHVCGICHSNNMQYFSASTMGKIFAEEGLHACEECHGHHLIKKTNDDMIGIGENSVCLNCHSQDDEGAKIAEEIHADLHTTVATYDSAQKVQKRVQQIGMDDVEIGYLLQDSHQSLIQARTLVHTFNPEEVDKKTGESLKNSEAALSLADQLIKDYNVRRKGFSIATIFITILVIALFFKIREIDKKEKIKQS